jgi:uncharacterized protein
MISTKDKINNILKEINKISQQKEIVVAFSGGLDSTVVSALAIQALGREKVEAITVSFGEYSYSKSTKNIQSISRDLNLKLKIVQGKKEQERVLKKGPACNKCTRIAKLGRVKKEASGRLVLTGSPLLELNKEEIRKIADYFSIKILQIGESKFREGCKLKHLLKPLAAPHYHGQAAAEANELLLSILEQEEYDSVLANVKIIGPLNKNIGLVNVSPLPEEKLKEKITEKLKKVKTLEKVEIEVEWLLTTNKSLSTFQVIDYEIIY